MLTEQFWQYLTKTYQRCLVNTMRAFQISLLFLLCALVNAKIAEAQVYLNSHTADPDLLEETSFPALPFADNAVLPQEKYRIVYTVLMNDEYTEYDIFSMNMDGSDQVNLTNEPGVDWAYYANNYEVFFVSDRDTTARTYLLYRMNAFGENLKQITNFRLQDSWVSTRNDNSEILVTIPGTSYFDTEIWLIDSEGTKIKQLTSNSVRDTDPAFSPDGSKIAFRSARGEDPKAHEEIWIMDADGQNPKQLTFYPEGQAPPSRSLYKAGPPVWSPDGKWITFISHRNGRYNIYKIRPDGTGFARLTSNDMNEGYFTWTPDGKQIIFESYTTEENIDLYIMNVDGSDVIQLTNGTSFEQCPIIVMVR